MEMVLRVGAGGEREVEARARTPVLSNQPWVKGFLGGGGGGVEVKW